MTKKADTWMPWYVADYLADTTHLSTERHGAYCLMLMAAWKRGGTLPKDDQQLAEVTKLGMAKWKASKDVLLEFFKDTGTSYAHKRVTEERNKAQEISDKKALSGKGGAEKRWGDGESGGTRSQRLAAARAKGSHSKEEWDSLQEALGYKCVKCSIGIDSLNGMALTKDHVQPIYQGGDDSIFNLQPMCRNCNSGKGNDTTDYRETTGIDWRKRLSECLAKRLANAKQTPTPARVSLPSPIPLESGIPGADAPLSPAVLTTALPPRSESDRPEDHAVTPACPLKQIVGVFAVKCPTLPKPRYEMWKDSAAADAMRQRWKWLLSPDAVREDSSRYATTPAEAVDWFGRFFEAVHDSDFLSGRSGAWKHCDLGWLMKRENFMKVVQGNYTNKDHA